MPLIWLASNWCFSILKASVTRGQKISILRGKRLKVKWSECLCCNVELNSFPFKFLKENMSRILRMENITETASNSWKKFNFRSTSTCTLIIYFNGDWKFGFGSQHIFGVVYLFTIFSFRIFSFFISSLFIGYCLFNVRPTLESNNLWAMLMWEA